MKIFCSSLFIIGGWLLVDQIRHNDAVLGRWMCVDPLAEKYLNIGSYLLCMESCKIDKYRWKRYLLAWKQKSSRCICQDVIYLKSATKPLNVLIAFTRPLITEFALSLQKNATQSHKH